ncbi:MAG: ABC transporter ATP-binding protein [Geminicoccaceae bacterium]|nr:ABC transporter ATP-binding protein [Geminicoccaceae bacterium]MCX8100581.1 ABC transporter ATP-binding protein [Geminicoccaceae bacterium]MDW8369288.1 ABC transporter ATP-binding protein [Geminicoccaceae bacterium]
MSTAPLLRIEGLEVAFADGGRRIRALRGLDLSLAAGERLALLGESGSGKSTALFAIAGLLEPGAEVAGRIAFPALGRTPEAGRDLGLVFQDPFASLDPVLDVATQIAEPIRYHLGASWAAARAQAVVLLRRVGIARAEQRARDAPHRFSGGERQRIAIAAAIAAGPRLLLADEPTAALDTVTQAQILDLLDGLVREQRTALLLVTHDPAVAARIADRIAVLYAGRCVEAGPSARLLAAPRHPYSRALLAAALDLERPPPRPLPEIPGEPPDPTAELAGCPFAPRCAFAWATCRSERPAWIGEPGDGAACHLLRP